MRVSANEFIRDSASNLFDIKGIRWVIFCDSGMEVDLKEKIAKFFSDCRPVILLNCFDELVTLFEQIFEKRGVGLLGIPRTASG
jgi:hypothetical protein